MSESSNDQKIAADWIRVIESPSALSTREKDIYPRLTEWIEAIAPTRILDIGCGQGICSAHINLQGRSYTGIEPSPLLIDRAHHLYKDANKQFIIGTVENLPFDDSTFHAVFSVAVWHLLSDIKTASREMERVLSPNGKFLIISANPDAYAQWTKPYENTSLEGRKFKGEVKLSDGTIATETLFLHSRDEILNSLRDAGLRVDNVNIFRQVDQHQIFIQIEGQKMGNTKVCLK